ncbi:hypothetical protein LTR04_000345 [Oleoguttula sp. CCFEE 6159]|nr:hypothetical protein LTR04_000345 [Oleoguttula sp. CCFEE 6159]
MRFRRHGALPIASIRRCFQCSSGHSNGYKQLVVHHVTNKTQYSTSLYPDDPEIAVLGGGITGLASAYYISKELPRAKITIYEAGPRVGGWMLSKRVEVDGGNILFEQGPRTLRPVKNGLITAHLVQELGMTDDVIFTKKTSPAARNRFIYYPDHLVKMPGPGMSPWQIAKSLWREPVFEGFALAALREAAIDQRPLGLQDESVGSFISRRFDRRIADNAVSAMLHGIYAGDVYKLSMKSLFPQQWRDEEEYGSVVRALLEKNRQPKKITKSVQLPSNPYHLWRLS